MCACTPTKTSARTEIRQKKKKLKNSNSKTNRYTIYGCHLILSKARARPRLCVFLYIYMSSMAFLISFHSISELKRETVQAERELAHRCPSRTEKRLFQCIQFNALNLLELWTLIGDTHEFFFLMWTRHLSASPSLHILHVFDVDGPHHASNNISWFINFNWALKMKMYIRLCDKHRWLAEIHRFKMVMKFKYRMHRMSASLTDRVNNAITHPHNQSQTNENYYYIE